MNLVLANLWRTMVDFFRTAGGFEGKEISTPSNPASGYSRVYPKTDHKWYRLSSSGDEVELGGGSSSVITETGTAGETLSQYQVVYKKAADSKWYKAQSDGTAAEANALGMVTQSGGIATDATGTIAIGEQEITNVAWDWSASIGGDGYVSATAGSVTAIIPTTVNQYAIPICRFLTAIKIFWKPLTGWLVSADKFDTSTGHDHDGVDSKKVDYANLTGTPIDVVGGRLVATDTTHLRWAFVTSNQIMIHDGTNWQLVKCSAEDSVLNTANDVAGTGLVHSNICDVFAKYVSVTELSLEFARWKVSTAGSSARHENYDNAHAYAVGDRVLSSSVYYLCIQAQGTSAGKTPASYPDYWESLGSAPANSDFNGLGMKDGVPTLGVGSTYVKYRWLGCIYTHSNGGTVNFKDDVNYRYVGNFYNQAPIGVSAWNTGDDFSITSTAWEEYRGGTGAVRGNFVLAASQDCLLTFFGGVQGPASVWAKMGMGLDATNSPVDGVIFQGYSNLWASGSTVFHHVIAPGYHFVTQLDCLGSSGTATYNSGSGIKSRATVHCQG
jgi:hypothetical protein